MTTTIEDGNPAAHRLRERVEAKYGDLPGVMETINYWKQKSEEFRRPYNRDMKRPTTHADVMQAEAEMLASIRKYAGK